MFWQYLVSKCRRPDEDTRTVWGWTFQWTPLHSTAEQMHPLKYSYDTLAEDCLDRLDEFFVTQSRATSEKGLDEKPDQVRDSAPKKDLYALLRDHHAEDEKLEELWQQANSIPEWVDWEAIERGQDVFYRYGAPALTGLAYQSLLGGMGANRVVETLARTGGFGVNKCRRRLYETTQHILQCTRSLESIQPGGQGHISSIRVRLLHAAVRRRIMRLSKERPDYYDVGKFGIPINDLDSIGTIASFSSTLIWLSFPRQGIFLREQEILDYVALWRLIAYYVGAPSHDFECPEKAKAIMESLMMTEIHPSEMSRTLANNIIESLQGQPPAYPSREYLISLTHWLNGDDMNDALGFDRPSFYSQLLVLGQCIFFMALCYTYRAFSFLDRRKVKALKRIFYAVVVENKSYGLGKETTFDFQYIPDFHVTTEKGTGGVTETKRPGAERRNLRTVAIATVAVGGLSWFAIKAVGQAISMISASMRYATT